MAWLSITIITLANNPNSVIASPITLITLADNPNNPSKPNNPANNANRDLLNGDPNELLYAESISGVINQILRQVISR